MKNEKSLKTLVEIEAVMSEISEERSPVRVSISLDKGLVDELRKLSKGVSFSRAVEIILKRALERGAA